MTTEPEYICPAAGGLCDSPYACARLCRRMLKPPIGALHFVGFKDERLWAAVKVFGWPDFFHRFWDERAAAEIGENDLAVFATEVEKRDGWPYVKHDPAAKPSPFNWNDSERF